MCFHKRSCAEIIYGRWNTGDGNGKIIRPCLDWCEHCQSIRISLLRNSYIFAKMFQKISILISRADCILCIMGVSREFKVEIGDHTALPLRVNTEYLVPGSGRPVEFRIADTPFFCSEGTYGNCIARLIATVNQSFYDSKSHGDCTVVILESVKIGIVVCGKQNHPVVPFRSGGSRKVSGNIVSRAVALNPGRSVEFN